MFNQKGSFFVAGRLIEVTHRIQVVAVVELEGRTMKAVAAALRDRIHNRTGGASVLGRELVCDQPDLFHDIGIVHELRPPGDAGVVRILPVNSEIVAAHPHTVTRKRCAVGERTISGVNLAYSRCRESHCKHVTETAACSELSADRQFHQAFFIELDADFDRGCVENGHIVGDDNRVLNARGSNFHVNDRLLIQNQGDRSTDVLGKTLELYCQFVLSDRKGRKIETAILYCDSAPYYVRLQIPDRNHSAGNGRSSLIHDASGYRASCSLSITYDWNEACCQYQKNPPTEFPLAMKHRFAPYVFRNLACCILLRLSCQSLQSHGRRHWSTDQA